MIKYTLKTTKIERTAKIVAVIEKKLKELERVIDKKDTSVHAELEVGMMTRHHKKGEVYFSEINLHAMKTRFRAVEESDDLYTAIDAMKDAIVREVTSGEKKARVKSRKGGREMKKRMKSV